MFAQTQKYDHDHAIHSQGCLLQVNQHTICTFNQFFSLVVAYLMIEIRLLIITFTYLTCQPAIAVGCIAL